MENFAVSDAEPIIEPDHTQSKKRESKPDRESLLKNLGKNKTATGRPAKPRQLTDADIVKLEGWYHMLAMPMMAFNARAANALMENSQQCAAAWRDLAKENDGVRRGILAILEGGAWGAVIMAHTPLIMAFLPGEMLDRFGFLDVQPNPADVGDDDAGS